MTRAYLSFLLPSWSLSLCKAGIINLKQYLMVTLASRFKESIWSSED